MPFTVYKGPLVVFGKKDKKIILNFLIPYERVCFKLPEKQKSVKLDHPNYNYKTFYFKRNHCHQLFTQISTKS